MLQMPGAITKTFGVLKGLAFSKLQTPNVFVMALHSEAMIALRLEAVVAEGGAHPAGRAASRRAPPPSAPSQ